MHCKDCKKIFKEDEPSWYDELTQKHTCDECEERRTNEIISNSMA